MRILLVHNYYQLPGGEDQVYSAEASLLQAYGHRLSHFTMNNEIIRKMNPFVLATKTIWNLDVYKRLKNRIESERPELVHFHNIFPLISPSAYYACRDTGVPIVQSLHNYRLFCLNALLLRDGKICEECIGRLLPWPGILYSCYKNSRRASAVTASMLLFHRLRKTYINLIDLYIALTLSSKNKFIQGGLPQLNIVVKPNFVSVDPGLSAELRNCVLFVGRFDVEKGIDTLLEAWRGFPAIPLKAVGAGPLFLDAQKKYEQDRGTQIELTGAIAHEEVLFLLQAARLLVVPSRTFENFPLVIAEAFACGVPVIASRLGVMAEIVEDGKTGLLFTPGDAEDLAAKVEWAWNHPVEMAEMGKSARREYEEKYTAERNYQMLMEIYQKAIENHRRQR